LSTVVWFKQHGILKPTHTSAFSIRKFYPPFTSYDIRTSAYPLITRALSGCQPSAPEYGRGTVVSHACNVNVRFQRKE